MLLWQDVHSKTQSCGAALQDSLFIQVPSGFNNREAMEPNPEKISADSSPEAWFFRGNQLLSDGQIDSAVEAFRQALARNPRLAEAQYNLGYALMTLGRLDVAIEAFARAIQINPGFRAPYGNLAVALSNSGRLEQAAQVCRQAVRAFPGSADCHSDLASVLRNQGRVDEAISVFQRAIELDATYVPAYRGLALAYESKGNLPEAVETLRACQQVAGPSVECAFELAALGAVECPEAPPREYVAHMFNDYAERFDEHLTRSLQYVGPRLLLDAVVGTVPSRLLDIIDLGCGTGLCGQLFRTIARKLTGIDLASLMLAKARARGVYDELEESDIIPALQKRIGVADLILAADVFIYIGRLDELFEGVSKALRPGGLFAFTVESQSITDYMLQPTRRYAHSVEYVRRLASRYRFDEISIRDAVLREEKQVGLCGKVVVLRASGSEP